ncbi:hypothetical protein NDI52_07330 [Leptolyngbya sp. PL-A3]|uniref:hypothetical protein n=1 Tax=Leptolyngbya sp. PL-A3 TaxID=2933911 RepID=UPI00329779BB
MNKASSSPPQASADELPKMIGEVICEVLYLHSEIETLSEAIAQLRAEQRVVTQLLLIALGGLTPEEAQSLVVQVFSQEEPSS